MSSFQEADLAPSLLAFAIAFYIFGIAWAEIRRTRPVLAPAIASLSNSHGGLVQKGRSYRTLVLCFLSVIISFIAVPSLYHSLVPVKALNTPIVNVLGLITLVIALVWMVVVQLDIDKELHENIIAESEMTGERLAFHIQRLGKGYLIMFLGITLAVTNMADLILLIIAFVHYNRKLPAK